LPEAEEVVLDTAERRARDRLARAAARRQAGGALFPRQWRLAARTGRSLPRAHRGRHRPRGAQLRGYGGSSGAPTEAGLVNDALAAYAFTRALTQRSAFVLWCESLGTGVAVALAPNSRSGISSCNHLLPPPPMSGAEILVRAGGL